MTEQAVHLVPANSGDRDLHGSESAFLKGRACYGFAECSNEDCTTVGKMSSWWRLLWALITGQVLGA
jgi:hypothetical protein